MKMVGLLGVLAAGAAQGYGEAKNREVDLHNAATIENNRETLRQQFENHRFERGLQANMQQAEMKAKHDSAMYQRKREDKLLDTESERKFQDSQLDKRLNNQKSIAGMKEAGRNSRALLRRDAANSGGESGGVKAQSTMGKAIQDMMNMGLASDPEEARYKLEKSGLVNELYKRGGLNQDAILNTINQWHQSLYPDRAAPQQQSADFIFNPQTGRLESTR